MSGNRARVSNHAFALPVALGVIFVLVILVLAVVSQGHFQRNVQQSGESKTKHTQVLNTLSGKMLDILSSADGADAKAQAFLGLSSPPPPPGGAVVPFGGKVEGYTFSGSFNGGAGPWSTFQPPTQQTDSDKDGYGAPAAPSYNKEKLPVPPGHSLIFTDIKGEKERKATYYTLISNMAPYGALAPKGAVELRSASFTTDPDADAKDSGSLLSGGRFYVSAGKTVHLGRKSTAVAQSQLPASSKPFTVDDGSSCEQEPEVPIDEETLKMLMKLQEEIAKAMGELEGNAKDPGFAAVATCIAMAAATTFLNRSFIGLGDFSFDGKRLVWGGSLYIPRGMVVLMPFPLKVTGSLFVDKEACLVVAGDLIVERNLFIKRGSVVYASEGKLSVEDRVEVLYSANNYEGITSAIVADEDVKLGRGVRHMHGSIGSGNVSFPFEIIAPKPPKHPKFLRKLYDKLTNAVFKPLMQACGPVGQFLMGQIPVGKEDRKTPGLLIASLEGAVKVEDHDKDATLAGLIITKKGITIEMPPDGSGVFTGFLLTFEGGIFAFQTELRYYPYFTHGLIPIGGGKSAFVGAVMPHVVSTGAYTR